VGKIESAPHPSSFATRKVSWGRESPVSTLSFYEGLRHLRGLKGRRIQPRPQGLGSPNTVDQPSSRSEGARERV